MHTHNHVSPFIKQENGENLALKKRETSEIHKHEDPDFREVKEWGELTCEGLVIMSVELSGVLFWFLEAISSREREREDEFFN